MSAYDEFDRPMSDDGAVTVTINGQRGAHQFFQFRMLGPVVLHAVATDANGGVGGGPPPTR